MGSEGPPPSQPDERPGSASEKDERFGPLRLRRTTKEDGRALILYYRIDDPEEPQR
jgi:hypothetical protein